VHTSRRRCCCWHEQHLPIGEELEHLSALFGHGGVREPCGVAPVVADDLVRWQDEEGKCGSKEHEGHERNVSGVVDTSGIAVIAVVVEREGKQPSKDASKVVEAPEDGDVGAVAIWGWVGRPVPALRRVLATTGKVSVWW
jgi:hypothetical protein